MKQKTRTLKDLIGYCVSYTTFMREHDFTKEELLKLDKKFICLTEKGRKQLLKEIGENLK